MRIASSALLAVLVAWLPACGWVGYEELPASSGDTGDAGADASGDAGDGGPTEPVLASVCSFANGLVILDAVPTDDAAGASIAAAIASGCGSFATTSASQDAPGVLEPGTNRPIGGPSALYVVGGGEAYQRSIAYLQIERTPVAVSSTGNRYVLVQRSTGQLIRDVDVGTLTPDHDIAIVQIAREPTSGTVVLNVYGYYGNGTDAGVHFFVTQLAPSIATDPNAYYVIDWTDRNGDSTPNDGDSFQVVGSGR